MTNKEQLKLIAQARELCEEQIIWWNGFIVEAINAGSHSDHKYGRNNLNAWTTHLAEMDELIKTVESMGGRGIFYPIHFEELLTKAKRLLGVE